MLRSNKLSKQLQAFDLHPKTVDDVKEKSSYGAIVTILVLCVLSFLIISEVRDYYTPSQEDVLVVNHNRGEKMKINLRITFISLPCTAVNIDITDRLGEEKLAKQIAKVPFRGDFDDLKKKVYKNNWMDGVYKNEGNFWENLQSLRIPGGKTKECFSCYEAQQFTGQCCNSCHQLKEAYAEAGLDVDRATRHPQCSDTKQAEGCLISGTIEVNKMQGNFHVAVGESHIGHGRGHHHHWPTQYRKAGFNTSHYIHHFSFGEEFPGMVNPLDGFTYVEPGIGQQQYFVQVVPTVYEKGNGEVINSNQYSMTHHYNKVDLTSEHIELPGVFFKYDISPLVIHISEKNKSFTTLVVRCLALSGGIWALVGVLYSTSKSIVDYLLKLLK